MTAAPNSTPTDTPAPAEIPARWEYVVGVSPHQVVAFEDVARGRVVTLRWHVGKGKARQRVLKALGYTIRGKRGGEDKAAKDRAIASANRVHSALVQGLADPATVIEEPVAAIASADDVGVSTTKTTAKGRTPAAALTLREGWALAQDPDAGKWPKETEHRIDIDRAMQRAEEHLGRKFRWADMDRAAIRKLWRRELARLQAKGHRGVRGAMFTVDLVLAVGAWLRDEQYIPLTAALRWDGLKVEYAKDAGEAEYEKHQPRYTLAEYRALLRTAWQADERYGFLYGIGVEGRLGQVAKSMRTQLASDFSRLRVLGRGKKKGVVIVFTPQQRADVTRVLTTGYLAGLEAAYRAGVITDYPLFPGHHLPRGEQGQLLTSAEHATRPPVQHGAWRTWHREAERLAGIPYVKGRGPYGGRRAGVDGAKAEKISREGLKNWGGWSNQQIPDQEYADQEQEYARDEAADVRARVRGEVAIDAPASDPRAEHLTERLRAWLGVRDQTPAGADLPLLLLDDDDGYFLLAVLSPHIALAPDAPTTTVDGVLAALRRELTVAAREHTGSETPPSQSVADAQNPSESPDVAPSDTPPIASAEEPRTDA